MVLPNGMFVNNNNTSYETYETGNGGKRYITSAKEIVSLIVYLFLQRGF